MRELHGVAFDDAIAIRVDWRHYIDTFIADCTARHRRNAMPAHLAEQALPHLAAAGDFSPPAQPRLIHMDIHPWNLLARNAQGHWTLSGLIDFGDAIVGNNDLFEALTPPIFMAQSNPLLVKALLDACGLLDVCDAPTLRRQLKLMATALIRPDSDLGFCMQQVPIDGPRATWEQIALQIFPVRVEAAGEIAWSAMARSIAGAASGGARCQRSRPATWAVRRTARKPNTTSLSGRVEATACHQCAALRFA
ncbi:phosphotransferase [Xanthomonas hyacinthi]|nr:phosphotransferase [Xanthomonas hyacinthi]KLD77210.1 hypothetical protein Y886_17145 [Xanthomonas hyacinthi DSM 19077]QGY75664.1 phosphotransferase [Xanthomonas hyacinthi]